jgi:hypothetical protein
MDAKEKALELINKFRPHAYNGPTKDSDPNSQTEDKRMDIYHAKQIAYKTLDVVKAHLPFTDLNTSLGKYCEQQRQYLEAIKEELDKF